MSNCCPYTNLSQIGSYLSSVRRIQQIQFVLDQFNIEARNWSPLVQIQNLTLNVLIEEARRIQGLPRTFGFPGTRPFNAQFSDFLYAWMRENWNILNFVRIGNAWRINPLWPNIVGQVNALSNIVESSFLGS